VSVTLDPALLNYELAIRAMSGTVLARRAGLSDATVSTTRAGRPIAEESARLIAAALTATPVDPVLKKLIPPPSDPGSDEPRRVG
jgi:hypothetical protein